MYWIWRETDEEQFRDASPVGVMKQEVAALTKCRRHLIVSGHQLLDGLSVDGGYVLDVGAFLLGKRHVTVSEKPNGNALHAKVTRVLVSRRNINPTWSDAACSWATMMCSCPRACRRSGRMVV